MRYFLILLHKKRQLWTSLLTKYLLVMVMLVLLYIAKASNGYHCFPRIRLLCLALGTNTSASMLMYQNLKALLIQILIRNCYK